MSELATKGILSYDELCIVRKILIVAGCKRLSPETLMYNKIKINLERSSALLSGNGFLQDVYFRGCHFEIEVASRIFCKAKALMVSPATTMTM